VPPSSQRFQDYSGQIRLGVPDVGGLSSRTAAVIAAVGAMGGYVVSVDYGSATSSGTSTIDVKVPIGRVQEAVRRFSALGSILAEQVNVDDVQGRVDTLAQRIGKLRLTIARLRARLTSTRLTPEQRAILGVRLARVQNALADATARRSRTIATASYARLEIDFELTPSKARPHVVRHSGTLGGTTGDALFVLGRIGIVLLYAAIVSSPALIVLVLVLAGARLLRSRRQRRLLEQA